MEFRFRNEEIRMNRRELLSSIVITALAAEAQETGGGAPPSLYIPKAHLVEDRKFLQDFMDEFAFIDLVTASPTPRITHVPVLLDRMAGSLGTIRGHISKQNEQTSAFDHKQEAVAVFRGPSGYISPAWYAARSGFPTWNFAAVHATGKLTAVTEPKALRALLLKLVDKFETYEGTGYDITQVPDSQVEASLARAVGFEMQIERLEGKFKLGQERSPADREGILANLPKARRERPLEEITDSFYKR